MLLGIVADFVPKFVPNTTNPFRQHLIGLRLAGDIMILDVATNLFSLTKVA